MITYEHFYEQILALRTQHENRDLEAYVLALYALVEQYREREMTAGLLLQMISEAFTATPLAFRDEWLDCTEAPDPNVMSHKFTAPSLKGKIDMSSYAADEGIGFTIAVLRFQAAELHRMRGKQLEDKYRFFGVDSDTGNRWYNFDPFSNLECGTRCCMGGGENEATEMQVSWQTLGELLEYGRIYE